MRVLESLVQTAAAKALGYALLHFVWEGAALALLLMVALSWLRSSSARHALACLALLAMPIAFAVTFWLSFPAGQVREKVLAPGVAIQGAVLSKATSDELPRTPTRLPWTNRLPWVTPVWIAGVLMFYLRSLAGWLAAQRLRRVGVCTAVDEWQERLEEIKGRLRVSRPVLLLESCWTDVPVVIGFLRPVILMPLGLLSGFPAEQVEAFLVHELAHIRRCDYLINLAQSFVEGLLFYHPAVWWISARVRTEREHCCDDSVVAFTGDARGYAAALTTLEEKRWVAAEPALAVTGGNLMKRIHRLLGHGQPTFAAGPVLGLLLVSACVALAAWKPSPAPQPLDTRATAVVLQTAAPKQAEPIRLMAQAQTQAAPPAANPQSPPVESLLQDLPVEELDRQLEELNQRLEQVNALQQQMQQRRAEAQAQPQQREDNLKIEMLLREMADLLRAMEEENAGRSKVQADQLRQVEQQVSAQAQATREGQLRSQLETPYDKWLLEDVAYIITDNERAAFKRLETDKDREQFIERFWLRRDPTPGTPRSEFKEEYYRRIGFANGRFAAAGVPGWKTDRGRIYITFGPPDEIDIHPSGGAYERPAAQGGGQITTFPFEDWRYRYIQGIGNDVIMEFVDVAGNGLYHMTSDPSEKDAIRK